MRTMRTLTLNETDWRGFQARRGESLKPVGASRRSEVLNEWFVGLQRLWRHVQATRSRDAIYGYLRRVFDFVRGWKNRGRGRRLVRHAQEFAGAEINKNAEIYSTIIKATT